MAEHRWRLSIVMVTCILLSSVGAFTQGTGGAYDRGYREGVLQGAQDSRLGREPQPERSRVYQEASRGYQERHGSRDVYRDDFRRGFAAGYQAGYDHGGRTAIGPRRLDLEHGPQWLGVYEEPAFKRGYRDGWAKGMDDSSERHRYDPVRHRDYRGADEGYTPSYGSKDAYRTNYRAGFRQGYDDGYRKGAERPR